MEGLAGIPGFIFFLLSLSSTFSPLYPTMLLLLLLVDKVYGRFLVTPPNRTTSISKDYIISDLMGEIETISSLLSVRHLKNG